VENPFAYQFVKPFIGQTGKGSNEFHVDHLVIKQGCIFRYHDEFSPGILRESRTQKVIMLTGIAHQISVCRN
jgi:hypothetical protein